MPKPGEIRYCSALGGEATNAAFVWIPPGSFWMGEKENEINPVRFIAITKGFWLQQTPLTERQYSGRSYNLPKQIFLGMTFLTSVKVSRCACLLKRNGSMQRDQTQDLNIYFLDRM